LDDLGLDFLTAKSRIKRNGSNEFPRPPNWSCGRRVGAMAMTAAMGRAGPNARGPGVRGLRAPGLGRCKAQGLGGGLESRGAGGGHPWVETENWILAKFRSSTQGFSMFLRYSHWNHMISTSTKDESKEVPSAKIKIQGILVVMDPPFPTIS